MAFFLKTNVIIQFLQQTISILNKKRQFFNENIFEITTSVPVLDCKGVISENIFSQKCK
jgi:hypothetical protein